MASVQKSDLAKSSIKALKSYAKKTTASHRAANDALVKLGTHTKKGQITKAYK